MRLGSVLLFFHQPGSLQKDYSMTGKIKYAARGSKKDKRLVFWCFDMQMRFQEHIRGYCDKDPFRFPCFNKHQYHDIRTETKACPLKLFKIKSWTAIPSIVMHDCICSELSFF